MADERSNLSLPLDVDKSTNQDDNVQLRRDSHSLRRARERSKERTPTMVVSDAFTFLNDNHISIVDAIEEGTLQADGGEKKSQGEDQCSEKPDMKNKPEEESASSHLVHLNHCDKCLPQAECYFSKDSGFASLERHLSGGELENYQEESNSSETVTLNSLTLHSKPQDNLDEIDATTDSTEGQTAVATGNGQSEITHDTVTVSCASQKTVMSCDSTGLHAATSSLSDAENCNSNFDSQVKPVSPLTLMSDNESVEEDHYESKESENSVPAIEDVALLQKHSATECDNRKSKDTNAEDSQNTDSEMKTMSPNVCEEKNTVDENHCKIKDIENSVPKSEDVGLQKLFVNSAAEGDNNKMSEVSNDPEDTETIEDDRNEIKDSENSVLSSEDVCLQKLSANSATEGDNNKTSKASNDTEDTETIEDDRGENSVPNNKDVVLQRPSVTSATGDSNKTDERPSKSGLLLEANPSTDLVSDDSSDEDTGIYAETFRRSNWVRVSQNGQSDQSAASTSPQPPLSTGPSTFVSGGPAVPPKTERPSYPRQDPELSLRGAHYRSDSVTTTASEQEFKTSYMTRRKCLIQRADSQQEYHRLSARIYEEDKEVMVERTAGSEDLGLHLLDSHPAYITSVDADSPAEKAGIVEGQILVSINNFNILTTDHDDIIKLIQNCEGPIKLGVASTDFQPIRDLQAPVISGFMFKLGTSTLVRIWKKRFFVLRNDNCLYYYKNEQDLDPLGALPLGGYTISRHTDTSKDYCFKAEKYRARTYYFMTENRDQLTEWVAVLTEAVLRSKKQKESSSFMSVSSHNVSLPALDIRRPECSGYLLKMSPNSRTWRRRYCLLKDACIYYYKDVNSFSALGVAHLHGYKVDVEAHAKKKNSFSLLPPDAKMRQFCFGAENETDKKRWVESIIHSIQRWVPVSKNSDC